MQLNKREERKEAPDVVFVFRIGRINGQWRAKALVISSLSLKEWCHKHHDEQIEFFISGTTTPVSVKLTLADSTDWVEKDEDGLSKREPFLRDAAIEHRLQLAQIQPLVMFDISEELAKHPLPIVLGSSRGMRAKEVRAGIALEMHTIDKMPEVVSFIRNEFAEAVGDPTALRTIKGLDEPTGLALPIDTWLPCTLTHGDWRSDAVYRINNRMGKMCIMDIWSFTPCDRVEKGCQLISRRSSQGGVGTIGLVMEIVK